MHRFAKLSCACGITCLATHLSTAKAQPIDTWTGGGGNSLWSNSANWSNGTPNDVYGEMFFGNSGVYISNDDLGSFSEWSVYFNASSAYTLTDSGDQGINLFDYGGTQSKIENDGSAPATIDLPLAFSASTGTPRGEINAVGANLTFNNDIYVENTYVAGIQMYGNSGKTVTLNAPFNDNGHASYLEVNSGNTLIFNSINSYTGGTFICGGSTLVFGQFGTATGTTIYLGEDNGASGLSPTLSGTVSMTGNSQTISTPLVTVSGASSGALNLTSSNVSGPTNIWSGNVTLNSGLTVSEANVGATLNLGGTIGGNGGALVFSGPGNVSLTGTNTYSGGTTINGGTLQANTTGSANSATGSAGVAINSGGVLAGGTTSAAGQVGGTVNVASGATITAGSGASNTSSYGILQTGTQTWNSGGSYAWKLNIANTSYSTTSINSVNSPGNSGNMDALLLSSLTNNASSGNPFTINIVTEGNNGLTAGKQYKFAIANAATGTFTAALSAFTVNSSNFANSFTFSDVADSSLGSAELNSGGGDDLVVTFDATPEPTSLLLGGLAISPLMLVRRRKFAQVSVARQGL